MRQLRGHIDARPREEQQGYLISVSDLMAGLLFVFIIALMVFAAKLTYETKETKKARGDLEKKVNQLSSAKQKRSELLHYIADALIRAGYTRVIVNDDHGILHLPEDILFPSGRAELQPRGQEMLRVLSRVLVETLPQYVRAQDSLTPTIDAIFIEGHTDTDPVITHLSIFEDNWDLSTTRAINTYKFLISCDEDLDQLQNQDDQPIFSVSGYESKRPVRPNDTEENKRRNRRIDIRFLMTPPEATKARAEVGLAVQKEMEQKK
jgi:flagellar motor protein MotB